MGRHADGVQVQHDAQCLRPVCQGAGQPHARRDGRRRGTALPPHRLLAGRRLGQLPPAEVQGGEAQREGIRHPQLPGVLLRPSELHAPQPIPAHLHDALRRFLPFLGRQPLGQVPLGSLCMEDEGGRLPARRRGPLRPEAPSGLGYHRATGGRGPGLPVPADL